MKYVVEFQFKPGCKAAAQEKFQQHGPNRNPGFSKLGAWVGTRDDVLFVLCDAIDEAKVVNACEAWTEFGSYRFFPVEETVIHPYM